jgi:cytochrome o ubiquinol oxidase subunit IV
MHKSLSSRIIGYVSSLVLTFAAFFLVAYPEFFHFDTTPAFTVLLILALLQSASQSIFFLNVLSEKGPRWNLIVFASTISIVVIIIYFSIWIMHHLDTNMMPQH